MLHQQMIHAARLDDGSITVISEGGRVERAQDGRAEMPDGEIQRQIIWRNIGGGEAG